MRAFVVLVLLALSTGAANAQVVQLPNTGCPGSTAPTSATAPRIGRTFSFSWSCSAPNRDAYAMLGAVQGGGFTFDAPLTCVNGPCVWFPGPIGGAYLGWPVQRGGGTWSVSLPNDPRLVGTTWAIQCVCWCP